VKVNSGHYKWTREKSAIECVSTTVSLLRRTGKRLPRSTRVGFNCITLRKYLLRETLRETIRETLRRLRVGS